MKHFLGRKLASVALASSVFIAPLALSVAAAPAASAHTTGHVVGYVKIDRVVYGVRHGDRKLVGPGRFQGMTQTQVARHMHARAVLAVKASRARQVASRNGSRSAGNAAAVRYALAQVGKPYVWGATGPNAFDCSGLTGAAYRAAGKRIPRTSGAQRAAGRVIPRSQMQPGDLIWTPGHITMYVGGGRQVAARSPGTRIAVQGIWQRNYTVVRF